MKREIRLNALPFSIGIPRLILSRALRVFAIVIVNTEFAVWCTVNKEAASWKHNFPN